MVSSGSVVLHHIRAPTSKQKRCRHHVATAILSSRWRVRRRTNLAVVEEAVNGKSSLTDTLFALGGCVFPPVMVGGHRISSRTETEPMGRQTLS